MNPKSAEARARIDNPFEGMKIDDATALSKIQSRSPCRRCGKSRMYFCYTCFIPVAALDGHIPICNLPVKIDIIKHRREIDGKSTAAHAAVLAPEDVKVYTYPKIPSYDDDRTVLLYPGTEALTVPELFSESASSNKYVEQILADMPKGYNVGTLMKKIICLNDNADRDIFHSSKLSIEKVVIIDSTWNQSRGIYIDERLKKLPTIVLQGRPSQFWRHQKGSPRWYLSTIEALHQLLLELHTSAWGRRKDYCSPVALQYPVHPVNLDQDQCDPYSGQYDNLLYFFKFLYEKIHSIYKHEDLLAYHRPMI